MTYAYAEAGGYEINKIKENFCNKNPNLRIVKKTLGHELYLILVMRHALAVIGNSSSGVIEAPMIGVPTVNIGNRQEGRIMGDTIFKATARKKSIILAINKALKYDRKTKNIHPFGKGKTSEKILYYIKSYLNKKKVLHKKFFDIR